MKEAAKHQKETGNDRKKMWRLGKTVGRMEAALIVCEYNQIRSTRKKLIGKPALEFPSVLLGKSEPVFHNFKSYSSVYFKDLLELTKSYRDENGLKYEERKI